MKKLIVGLILTFGSIWVGYYLNGKLAEGSWIKDPNGITFFLLSSISVYNIISSGMPK